jgi:hypothetical protein
MTRLTDTILGLAGPLVLAVVGDSVGYAMGRRVGERLLAHPPPPAGRPGQVERATAGAPGARLGTAPLDVSGLLIAAPLAVNSTAMATAIPEPIPAASVASVHRVATIPQAPGELPLHCDGFVARG